MAMKKTITLGKSAAAPALVNRRGLASIASAANATGAVSDSNTGATQSTSSEHGEHDGHRGAGPKMASGLVEKVDVEESELADALDTFREANKPAKRT